MITITREFGFDMGHMLPDYSGDCYRPHGHRYRCKVTIAGPEQTSGPERGMILDFAKLAATFIDTIVATYDHRFAVSQDDHRLDGLRATFTSDDLVITSGPPTAENLARWIGTDLRVVLAPAEVVGVRLWETPTCSAEWSPIWQEQAWDR